MNNLDEMAQWYAMSVHLPPYKYSDIKDAYKAGWNAKGLDAYTTDELRAELSRRYKEKKAADALKPRCRNCKHFKDLGFGFMKGLRCMARTYVMHGKTWNYQATRSGHCDKFEPKE